MAETKYLNYEGLSVFKDLLANYIDEQEEQSLKSLSMSDDGDAVYFYKVENPTENTQPAYIVKFPNIKDGVSPTVEVSKSDGVTTITITDIDGEHTAIINDGEKGEKGDTGEQGIQGEKGDTGATGATGADGSAATIEIGTVTTGDAGTDAKVTNSGTTNAAKFDFTIPKGEKGDKGDKGDDAVADLSGYLPLSGGTMTGTIYQKDLTINDGNQKIACVQMFDEGSTNGSELVIGANGNTFIGAGESYKNLRTDFQNNGTDSGESYGATSERFYLTSDTNIYFYSNCNTIGKRLGIVYDSDGELRPLVNKTRSLGDSSYYWDEAYINKAYNPTGTLIAKNDTSSNGNTGYLKFLTITITTTYANTPIWIQLSQRKHSGGLLNICFSSNNNKTPTVNVFDVYGDLENIYYTNPSDSVYEFYIKKSESYDVVQVVDLGIDDYMISRLTLDWTQEYVADVPSSNIANVVSILSGDEVDDIKESDIENIFIEIDGK